ATSPDTAIPTAAADTLTLKGTPPNLRDQLQRRTSGGN
ncbi:hypothetical protein Q6284_33340, partial [Klebsiella pneumoniae]